MGVFRNRRGHRCDCRYRCVRAAAREGARRGGAAHDRRAWCRLRMHRVRSRLGEPSRHLVVCRTHRGRRPVLRRGAFPARYLVGIPLQLLRRGAYRIDRASVVCDLVCRVLRAFGGEGAAVHGGGRRLARRVRVGCVSPSLRSQRLRRWGGGRCARSCRAAQAVFPSGLPFCAVLSHLVSDRAVPRCVLADDVWRAIHALPRAVLHRGGACDCGVSHVHATDALPQLYVSLSLVGIAGRCR